MTNHDHLCSQDTQVGFCPECARIEVIREDERCRVIEQIMALPENSSIEAVGNAIMPIDGDILRRKEPRADLAFGG